MLARWRSQLNSDQSESELKHRFENLFKDTLSSAIGYKDGQTDDLWMLVVYGDKKADKDAAVLSAIHNAAEDVSEESFYSNQRFTDHY